MGKPGGGSIRHHLVGRPADVNEQAQLQTSPPVTSAELGLIFSPQTADNSSVEVFPLDTLSAPPYDGVSAELKAKMKERSHK